MNELVVVLNLVVICVFLWSGTSKLLDLRGFFSALDGHQSLAGYTTVAGIAVIVAEFAVVAMRAVDETIVYSLILSVMLLATFCVVVIDTLRRGDVVRCACFGTKSSEKISFNTLLRIALLALADLTTLRYVLADRPPNFSALSFVDKSYAMMVAVLIICLFAWGIRLPKLFATRAANITASSRL